MEKALIVNVDGTHEVVEFEIGKSYDLLRNAVEGWIECVSLDNADLWLNEEGKLIGLPVNYFATELFTQRFGAVDVIVGNVVLTGGADEEGDTVGLDENTLQNFLNALN